MMMSRTRKMDQQLNHQAKVERGMIKKTVWATVQKINKFQPIFCWKNVAAIGNFETLPQAANSDGHTYAVNFCSPCTGKEANSLPLSED